MVRWYKSHLYLWATYTSSTILGLIPGDATVTHVWEADLLTSGDSRFGASRHFTIHSIYILMADRWADFVAISFGRFPPTFRNFDSGDLEEISGVCSIRFRSLPRLRSSLIWFVHSTEFRALVIRHSLPHLGHRFLVRSHSRSHSLLFSVPQFILWSSALTILLPRLSSAFLESFMFTLLPGISLWNHTSFHRP